MERDFKECRRSDLSRFFKCVALVRHVTADKALVRERHAKTGYAYSNEDSIHRRMEKTIGSEQVHVLLVVIAVAQSSSMHAIVATLFEKQGE